MIPATRVALGFALTAFVGVTCFAQLPPETTAKIKSLYNTSTNETTVVVHPHLIVLAWNNHDPTELIALTVSFTYSGKTLIAPPTNVKLSIVSRARFGWEFENPAERSLSVKVDGQKNSLGILDRVEARRIPLYTPLGNYTRFYYAEQLAEIIPIDVFQKIANGKKVVIRAGKYEQQLSKQDREILRDVASRMWVK